ncbi:transglutaminase family protein [Mesorhizobium microcysteis]|uniref:Transglutaminase family protein n=1 Tax=Neoaquamicrobium microcysteis TaxID=2682781 RepID=A0A5D4H329_9HYPH|nr:transglutaminase family protein [Mesorhizobium microcysteis]TYR35451.1 transglutaminase family protein [Mesorhizobium microcysteis]
MKLSIHHTTRYLYARPVILQPHRLTLRPRSSHDMAVLASSIDCSPVAQMDWTQDVFGNLVATAAFTEATDQLVIASQLRVDQSAAAWPVFRTDSAVHSFPFTYSPDDAAALGALCIPDYPDPQGELENWARAFVRGEQTDTLSLLKGLNAGVLGAISYRVREEEGTQAPRETLALGSGSCRDIAALFIDAVRRLGFGARAVSGYLFDPQALAGDPGSTHAWAEIYLPGAGWIAFDPTHRRVGGDNLIPVAVARSNRQIMPVIGGYLGAPDDFSGMDVSVEILVEE